MSNEGIEPLTVTFGDAQKRSGLSNSTLYKMVNKGLLETTRVFGRRLIVYASLKRALGIRGDGEPAPAFTPGLPGGKIKDSPGKRRKATANQRSSP